MLRGELGSTEGDVLLESALRTPAVLPLRARSRPRSLPQVRVRRGLVGGSLLAKAVNLKMRVLLDYCRYAPDRDQGRSHRSAYGAALWEAACWRKR